MRLKQIRVGLGIVSKVQALHFLICVTVYSYFYK